MATNIFFKHFLFQNLKIAMFVVFLSMWWRRSFSTMNNMNLFFLWRNSDLLSSFSDVYVCMHLSLFSYVICFFVVNIVDSFAIEASFLLFAWILKRVPHTIKLQFILCLVEHISTSSNNKVNVLKLKLGCVYYKN